MPRRTASFWRSRLAKWWPRMPSGTPSGACPCPWPWPGAAAASAAMIDPARSVRPVVVRILREGGDLVEVVGGRRRRRHPLEALRAPGVLLAAPPPPQRDGEIDDDEDEAEGEQRGARGRGHVQGLEALRILVIPAGQSAIAEQQTWDEGCIEGEDDRGRGPEAPAL